MSYSNCGSSSILVTMRARVMTIPGMRSMRRLAGMQQEQTNAALFMGPGGDDVHTGCHFVLTWYSQLCKKPATCQRGIDGGRFPSARLRSWPLLYSFCCYDFHKLSFLHLIHTDAVVV